MRIEQVQVTNPAGLNLRAAGVFCEKATKFSSKVTFVTGSGYEANAKSVLSVLGAGINYRDDLTLKCDGEDEEEAMNVMKALFLNGFE